MVKRGRVSNNYEFEVKYNCSGLIKFPLIQELCFTQCFPRFAPIGHFSRRELIGAQRAALVSRFAPIGTNWPFLLFLRNKAIVPKEQLATMGLGNKSIKQEGEGEVSEWFMVLVLKTSVMQVTVGSNPTLSGFFWRCGQVVRQRIANSSLPSSNLGAAYVFCKNNFLIYSKRVVVVACLPTTKPLGQSAPLICPGPD